ncbi:TRAP transporter small permease [Thalassospira sp.]|uniref:TRAP transporter small permease n=1 Tax=Thalassospira sp. TaxID=1912094 RepID=UPI003AA7DE16
MQPINKAPERRSFDIALPLKIAVGFALALILVLTLAQVVLRYFFDSPLLWSEELSRLLVVWMTFIGAAAVCWQGRHLSVDVFVVLLPERVRKFVRLINQFLALGFLTILTWKSFRIVKLENFQEMSILPLPAGTVRLAATVGAILMIIAIVSRIFLARRLHSKQPDNNNSSML